MRLLCDVMVNVSLRNDKCTLNWRAVLLFFPHLYFLTCILVSLFPSLPPRLGLCACSPRCDITTLLLYVEHLMWSVCENPEALVHSSPYSGIALIAGGSDWPYQIHSLCDQLLTVLVIVTSPLSSLCRWVSTICVCGGDLACKSHCHLFWNCVQKWNGWIYN